MSFVCALIPIAPFALTHRRHRRRSVCRFGHAHGYSHHPSPLHIVEPTSRHHIDPNRSTIRSRVPSVSSLSSLSLTSFLTCYNDDDNCVDDNAEHGVDDVAGGDGCNYGSDEDDHLAPSAGNNLHVYATHPFDDSRDYRRLLVQLEETERRFDDFWNSHLTRLRQCLELRLFEQAFRELQVRCTCCPPWALVMHCLTVGCSLSLFVCQTIFDAQLQAIGEMTEIGETVTRVDALLRQMKVFQSLCCAQIERAKEVIATGKCFVGYRLIVCLNIASHQIGQQLISVTGACPADVVQPKCDELSRVCDLITERLTRRMDLLTKSRDLMERVEKVLILPCDRNCRQSKYQVCACASSGQRMVHARH